MWTAAVAGPTDTRCWALLDQIERARAARFVFERHRAQFAAAHALKRRALASVCGREPASFAFETGPGGKPSVAGGAGPHFSISHCDGRVACAVSDDVEVGVDVEPIRPVITPDLIRAALAPVEADWLAQLDAADRPAAFFRIWTLKEAVIKATGRGLAQDLQSFSIAFDPLCVTSRDPAVGSASEWHLSQQLVTETHYLSCAARVGAAEVTIHVLPTALALV